jgi:aminoglycoside/choline kinase family phosphotransferase
MDRLEQLEHWLRAGCGLQGSRLTPASSDASFRRYFRAHLAGGGTRIVMDAPPEHEDCRPFVRIAALLREAGLNAPEVHASDFAQGFLLLSDLGTTTYLDAVKAGNPDPLYRDAIGALVCMQAASQPGVLPEYDRAVLLRELMLFPDWYIARQHGRELSGKEHAMLMTTFERILENNLAQPRVYVHRDYHSRNLMVARPNPGVLDFQDAVYGPVTYDLVSLLRDAYVEWQEPQVIDWAVRHWETARAAGVPVQPDFGEFYRDFDWMGVQRHLKVLGIFARLALRDGKRGYLDDQPLVMRYLRRACARYSQLGPLGVLLEELDTGSVAPSGYTF